MSYRKPKDKFNRSLQPKSKEAKSVSVPLYYKSNIKISGSETNNTIPVISAENNEVPKVNILITLEGGDLLIEDPKKAGLSQLTAMILNESTENFTTEEMSAKLDNIGSSISFSSGSRSLNNFRIKSFK